MAKFKFQKHQNISVVFHTIMTLKILCCYKFVARLCFFALPNWRWFFF